MLLKLHHIFIPSCPSIARSDLEGTPQSVTVGSVSSGPIYPCAIGACVANALGLVCAFDRCAVVVMSREAYLAGHAVCGAKVR